MSVTLVAARIVAHDGRSFWRCPYCGKTLGEVVSWEPERTVIIRANRRYAVIQGGTIVQTCTCGVESRFARDTLTA